MNKEKLRKFLIDSNYAGYAGGNEKKWIKESDGSTTIHFEKELWKSHDNFFGGEPYGGRTIVFYKNKPIWMMVYCGWVVENMETNIIYQTLRNALKKMPADYPFRGPKKYEEAGFFIKIHGRGISKNFLEKKKLHRLVN